MESFDSIKNVLRLIAIKLEEEQSSNYRIKKLFKDFFPLDAYKKCRPDVVEWANSDDDKIIDHFINQGHKEINLKEPIQFDKKRPFEYSSMIPFNYFRDVSDLLVESDISDKSSNGQRKLRFSKTLGNNGSIENNQAHVFAQQRTLLHLKSNSVCTWIPKNACSNMRFSIALDNGVISSKCEIGLIHNIHESLCASNKELLQAKYSFVILRNPFKRLLSFFLDKICHKSSLAENDTSYQEAQDLFNVTAETTFEDVLSLIRDNPEITELDQHIKPQIDFLIYKEYDDYYPFEMFPVFKSDIEEKIKLEIIDTREFNTIHTTIGLKNTDKINAQTPVSEINAYLNKGERPIALNMFTNKMIKEASYIYFNDILFYLKEVKNGTEELKPWIYRMFQG